MAEDQVEARCLMHSTGIGLFFSPSKTEQYRDRCKQGKRAHGPHARSCAPGAALDTIRIFIIFIILVGKGPGSYVIDYGWHAEAQRVHTHFDVFANGAFSTVANARVEQLRLGHAAHTRDDVAARARARGAAEQLSAVQQVVTHGVAARSVTLALPPRLRAAHTAGPGQTRLDGALGFATQLVFRAAAVLQRGAALGLVELHKGCDAVTRAPAPLAAQDRIARAHILSVRIVAIRLCLAVHDGLPAHETSPGATRRRARAHTSAEKQERAGERPRVRAGAPGGSHEPRHWRQGESWTIMRPCQGLRLAAPGCFQTMS